MREEHEMSLIRCRITVVSEKAPLLTHEVPSLALPYRIEGNLPATVPAVPTLVLIFPPPS